MKRSKICSSHKKGFTLVELMVVVVIMAILVAVAVPVYTSFSNKAKKRTCDSNRKILANTITNYVNGASFGNGEHQEVPDFEIHSENFLPVFYEIGGGAASKEITDFSEWLLSQFHGGDGIFCNDGGIITVEIIENGEAFYAQVVCSKHGSTY